MFILVETRSDVRDNRNYVYKWGFKKNRIQDKDLDDNQHIYLVKTIDKDFYRDPYRYYVNDSRILRKNPHRRIR